MQTFETFEHGADVGVRGFGKTLEEAFANGAKAMFSVMVNIEKVESKDTFEIECSSYDLETLFVEWLNHLLTLAGTERAVFSEFQVSIKNCNLKGFASGEKLDPERHEPSVEVKGATYSMLKVEEKNHQFIAQCVVDV